MIWATVSFGSCFCWLYRASPPLAADSIINLISYWPSGDVHVYNRLLCCWKRVFSMTSAFSWQNSVSLCPTSFCTPSPSVPITPGISWLPTSIPIPCLLEVIPITYAESHNIAVNVSHTNLYTILGFDLLQIHCPRHSFLCKMFIYLFFLAVLGVLASQAIL